MLKELVSSMQTELLGDEGSDCGTHKFLKVNVTKSNFADVALYRYAKKGNTLELITDDNKDKYIGKTVEIRSPMYCLRVGKQKCLCSKCAGEFYYKLGKKNIGLVTAKMAGSLSNLNLQKFHDNVVRMHKIDIEDMLI